MKPLAPDERRAVDHTARAKRLRDRAEECRTLARIMTTAANMAYYLKLAVTYDHLAEQQEQLARAVAELRINVQEK